MKSVKANVGLIWIREGFMLFRKRPFLLTSLFFGYVIIMTVLGIFPVLGQALPILLAPSFSILFMQVSSEIDDDKDVFIVKTGRKLFSTTIKKLLLLGCFYLLAALLAISISTLVDGGLFFNVMMTGGQVDAQVMQQSNMMSAFMVSGLLYLPAILVFWFAAPLIVWKKMAVSKAIFYSFFAVLHAWQAFIVYALAWLLLGFLLPSLISVLVAIMFGKGLAMLVALTLSTVLTVLMYCSFYPSYLHVFGKPDSEE